MGQTVHDERYKDIVLQALPVEYDMVRNANYEKRDFGLVDIRQMVHTMFVDSLLRSSHYKPVTGHDTAMQAAERTNSDVGCNYCRGVGHFLSDYSLLKSKGQRHGPNR